MRHHFQKRSPQNCPKVRRQITKPSFWMLEKMGPIKHPTIILLLFATMQNLSSYGNLKKRVQTARSFSKTFVENRRKVRRKVTKRSFWILETMGPIKHPTIILLLFATMQNLSSYGNLKKRVQTARSFSKTFVENRRKVRRKVTKQYFCRLETMGPIKHPTISLFIYATMQNLSSYGYLKKRFPTFSCLKNV